MRRGFRASFVMQAWVPWRRGPSPALTGGVFHLGLVWGGGGRGQRAARGARGSLRSCVLPPPPSSIPQFKGAAGAAGKEGQTLLPTLPETWGPESHTGRGGCKAPAMGFCHFSLQ